MSGDAPEGSRRERLGQYMAARKRHAARVSEGMFRQLVADALDTLPPYIQERMQNVAVVVENHPVPENMVRLGYRPDMELLGLYEGVPRTVRSGSYHLVVPDRITLYREAILLHAGPGEEAVVREIRKTIIHEIGHHFGLGDPEIERLEAQARAGGAHGS